MRYEVEIPQLQQFVSLLGQAPDKTKSELRAAMKRAGKRIKTRARALANVDTGKMRSSINIFPMGPLALRVGPRTSYAKAVHDGSRAHIIRPKAKMALYWPGAAHPVKQVNHPGYKGNPFMKRTKEQEKASVKEEFIKAGENVLKSLKV